MCELFIDLETDGLDPSSKILQIGWIIQDKMTNIIREHELYNRNIKLIPKEIEKLTGITLDKIQNGDTLNSILKKFHQDIIRFRPKFIIGHNINFDIGILNSNSPESLRKILNEIKLVCTKKLGKEKGFSCSGNNGGCKLSCLTKHFLDGLVIKQTHTALLDCHLTRFCYNKLMKRTAQLDLTKFSFMRELPPS